MSTIREILFKIGQEYPAAKSETFTHHPLATFVRKDAVEAFSNLMALSGTTIKVRGSVGQALWADAPWIAFLDELVTSTTRSGYYPLYMFAPDGKRVFLVMGQGVTHLKKQFKSTWKDLLVSRAAIIRSRVPEYISIFQGTGYDLKGNTTLSKSYRKGSAFHKRYDFDSLPDEETLVSDLRYMLSLYAKICVSGGADLIENEWAEDEIELSITEKKQIRMHKKIEGRANTNIIKRKLGYVCTVCKFDFKAQYGELGTEFIEVHHLIPYSQLQEGKFRSLKIYKDFAVLCANCHRMIHRMKSVDDIEGLKASINKNSVI